LKVVEDIDTSWLRQSSVLLCEAMLEQWRLSGHKFSVNTCYVNKKLIRIVHEVVAVSCLPM